MFFERARTEIYADLLQIDPVETGIRAKETVPKTPASGDIYIDPNMSSDRADNVPAFFISVNLVLILASDWDTAYGQAERWAPIVVDAVPSLFINSTRLITLQVPDSPNGRPALIMTGVRE